jgi:hypothetical protein
MTDRFDLEVQAIEADCRAETARRRSSVQRWRDVARQCRMISDSVANGHAVQCMKIGMNKRPAFCASDKHL